MMDNTKPLTLEQFGDLTKYPDASPLARLRVHAQSHRLRRRQTLATASADSVFIVRSGMLSAQTAAIATRPAIVELLYPGDIISLALADTAPGAIHTALVAAEVWEMSLESFRQELSRDPGLATYLFQQLRQQRARTHLHILTLSRLTSEERVAGLLLEVALRLGSRVGQRMSFDMPLSRNEVAEYLALNADTLSRIVSRFGRDNILQKSSRVQMSVSDVDALKALCPLHDAILTLHARI